MAAVLQPWLGDVLLVEASLALLWHFHGIRFQNARKYLNVSEKPIEWLHEIVIASSQSSRALQVLSTKPNGRDRELCLSDKRHFISAFIRQEARQSWESRTSGAIEDITSGTILDVRHFSLRLYIPTSPVQSETQVACSLVLELHDFRIAGCQGESMFGQPSDLLQWQWFKPLKRILLWWMDRKFKPLPESEGQLLRNLHNQKHSSQYSDIDLFIEDLREHFSRFKNDDSVRPLWDFVESMLTLDDFNSAAHIETVLEAMETSTNVRIESHGSKIVEARRTSGKTRDNEHEPDPTGESPPNLAQLPVEDTTKKKTNPAPEPLAPSSTLPESGQQSHQEDRLEALPSLPRNFSELSWTRKDGRIRSDQLVILKSNPWIPAPPGQADPRASMPLSVLKEITADKPSPGSTSPSVVAEDAASETGESTASIALDEATTQDTVYASEWSESPEPRRMLPPDSDDEETSKVRRKPSLTQGMFPACDPGDSFPKLPKYSGPSSSHTLLNEQRLTGEGFTESNPNTQTPNPSGSANAGSYVEIPAYSISSPSSSSPDPEPLTPAVQVPATAPSLSERSIPDTAGKPSQSIVPDTTIKPVVSPRSRIGKRHSSALEKDEAAEKLAVNTPGDKPNPALERRSPAQDSSPCEDPARATKRLRTEFFAEQSTLREARAAEVQEPPSPPGPARGSVQNQPQNHWSRTPPTSESPPRSPPSTAYRAFQRRCPDYTGSASHYASLSAWSARLVDQGELASENKDRFVLLHAAEYASYVARQIAAGEKPEGYEEFWRERAGVPTMEGADVHYEEAKDVVEIVEEPAQTKKKKKHKKDKYGVGSVFKAFSRKSMEGRTRQ